MSAALFPSLLLLVLGTSVLSAILGMVGGVILMGVFASILPVASAMVLHGAIQFAANGSRALILRRAIAWPVVGRVALGALGGVAVFALFAAAPPRWLLLLSLGLMPWLGWALARSGWPLDITRPGFSFSCGGLISLASLLSGVSGPMQDIFFTHTRMNRQQVVATKACIQAFGHLLKILYYGALLDALRGSDTALLAGVPLWFLPASLALAPLGSWLGTRVLNAIGDAMFFRLTRAIVLLVGTLIVLRALAEFL